jgi:hypothetical protein
LINNKNRFLELYVNVLLYNLYHGGKKMLSFGPILFFLFYLGILIFGVYFVITTIKSREQRNEYLKDIRDELREFNNRKTNNLN